MPILISPSGQRVFADVGTPLYNDYIAGDFQLEGAATPPPSASSNIAPPTAESNYPNYPTTTQTNPAPLPVVSDPNQASGNYQRAGLITPALKVDELYKKYFGRVGERPEREEWIFRPIEELDAFLRQEYKNASGHDFDGTPITEGNQQSQRDLNPQQYANTPDPQVTPDAGTQGTQGTTGSTGNTEIDDLIAVITDALAKITERGEVVNPAIEITPELTAEFLRKAESEINPYYASQLKLAREGFLTSVGYSGGELLQLENQLEQKYGQAVRGIGESAAEAGFAQSGIRQRGERDLAIETQQDIDARRRQFSFDAGQQARTFAQQYGSAQLPNQNLNNAPRVLAGQRDFQDIGGQSPLYNLSDEAYQNIIGSSEFERRGAVKKRVSEQESDYRTQEVINQQRQLIQ